MQHLYPDCYILAAMAADHYVAFSNPLHYLTIMSRRPCPLLVAGSYVMGSINVSAHTGFTFSLYFCKSNTINHFFFEVPPVLALSCSNIDINIMLLVFVGFNLMFTVFVVIFSYMYIMAAILKMSSAAGKKKVFTTCASHLIAVISSCTTLSYMYLQPQANNF